MQSVLILIELIDVYGTDTFKVGDKRFLQKVKADSANDIGLVS